MPVDLKKYDVLILGTGVSGLNTALHLDSDVNILICAKSNAKLSNSSLAQGGVAAVLDKENDNFDLHFNDTMVAGLQTNLPESVRVLVENGPDEIENLVKMGVNFDKHEDGELHMTLEGGHSRNRIVHHKDSTGDEMTRVMLQRVKELPNVTMLEETMCVNLIHASSGYFAHLLKGKELFTIGASFVVLATGGIGRVYKYTTNSAIATGDGIRFAYELGAKIKDLDLIQFHPTAFASTTVRERFLISEAVRGEGAYLLNCNKERFMHRYDDRLELAPRDKVSRSIMLEYRRTGSDKFYLDISHKDSQFLKNRFPLIYGRCLEYGVDLTKEPIPIFPCQHYLMGGIAVDHSSFTGVNRLYAVGECTYTGVHGNNRLASNSLLEAMVFSHRAAKQINQKIHSSNFTAVHGVPPEIVNGSAPLPSGLRTGIREIMQKSHFVMPDSNAAEKGLKTIEAIRSRLENPMFEITEDYCEAKSLATVASIILRGALKR